jgi:hypothetical protein
LRAFDDTDFAVALGDFEFGDPRFGNQVDQCFEFA